MSLKPCGALYFPLQGSPPRSSSKHQSPPGPETSRHMEDGRKMITQQTFTNIVQTDHCDTLNRMVGVVLTLTFMDLSMPWTCTPGILVNQEAARLRWTRSSKLIGCRISMSACGESCFSVVLWTDTKAMVIG